MKHEEPETLYLGQQFKKRNFPTTRKPVEMKFNETPLFKAQVKAEGEAHQGNLFQGKETEDHEDGETIRDKAL